MEEEVREEQQQEESMLNGLLAEKLAAEAIMEKHARKVIECVIRGKVFAEEYPAEYAEYMAAYNAAKEVEQAIDSSVDMHKNWEDIEYFYAGDRCKRKGKLYRALLDHKRQEDWKPDVATSLFVLTNEGEDCPEWVQPIGSQDAYPIGATVSHVGKKWESEVDNNVWEPGVFGWKEKE